MSGEDAQTNEVYNDYDDNYKELKMVIAYREAGGEVPPAKIMRSLGKQRELRIEERRRKMKMEKTKREDEDKKRRQKHKITMVKIDSIAFGILSVAMIVWTGVCITWYFGKINI